MKQTIEFVCVNPPSDYGFWVKPQINGIGNIAYCEKFCGEAFTDSDYMDFKCHADCMIKCFDDTKHWREVNE